MIGTGYVGLVSGACFADLGNTVYCVDKDQDKIDMLNSGEVPIYEPGLNEIVKKNYLSNRLKFTSDLSKAVKFSDIPERSAPGHSEKLSYKPTKYVPHSPEISPAAGQGPPHLATYRRAR